MPNIKEDTPSENIVIVYGNPIDGLNFVGLFSKNSEANDYGERELSKIEWWSAQMLAPVIEETKI